MKRRRIVVAGFMGACPIAGVIWQHIHYIVGLQRLGHEVYYVEDSARIPYDPVKGEPGEDFGYAVSTLEMLASQYAFQHRWAYRARYLPGHDSAGLSSGQIDRLYREADAVLNVCGSHEVNEELLKNALLVYIESDPGVEQIKVDQGDKTTLDLLSQHHALFTFGEAIGTEAFPVPLHGLKWQPTRQPVVTDLWETESAPPETAIFTTVANWETTGQKDIEWRGDRYLWSKSEEFLKFAALPERIGKPCELATEIKDPATRRYVETQGWRLTDPHVLTLECEPYRRFIRNSRGEFTVAKDQYVRLNTGSFSDRSACYLAARRPVITQDTGFGAAIPTGKGLFPFRTMEEVVEAEQAIGRDYPAHSRAASAIATEFFEAGKVLRSLLDRVGL